MPRLVYLKDTPPIFSQSLETATHLHSLLSHSDDTPSLSVERECAWCEHIPPRWCAACVFMRFPCSDSHLGRNVWNPSYTFILSHQHRQQRLLCKLFFQLGYYTNGPKTMSAFVVNVRLSLVVGWCLWVCACMPADLFRLTCTHHLLVAQLLCLNHSVNNSVMPHEHMYRSVPFRCYGNLMHV